MSDGKKPNQNPDVNYFVCTLGQAVEFNRSNPHPYDTVNAFLEYQARSCPDLPAVGFPRPGQDASKDWDSRIYTFKDLLLSSLMVAEMLHGTEKNQLNDGQRQSNDKAIALLCNSSEKFLFYWLGLMRLGHSVLLIAPQCKAPAIAHLCKVCSVSALLFDDANESLARKACDAARDEASINLCRRMMCDDTELSERFENYLDKNDVVTDLNPSAYGLFPVSKSDTAYLHHTSGTSTGLPKPIPQSHSAAIGVLPQLDKGHDKATFTTTPLYHGGVADCFRAWTSGALIWLFPGATVPITATNTIKSLRSASAAATRYHLPQVKYFSSVPYILQMMAADDGGLELLQGMDLVGFGGAALPQLAGDELVKNGVNLLSRFGSAECGFLMSSHRDYATDKAWQYLSNSNPSLLHFESHSTDLDELVVQSNWPHMAKRNKPDRSFATADLFEKHPTLIERWRLHSRADSQIALITGKKFDPAPLEDAIVASSPLIADMLITGTGKQHPSALLFRSPKAADLDGEGILNQVWPTIEKMNAENPAHTRLMRQMLKILPQETLMLEKSSKGTTLRKVAEEKYRQEIVMLYERTDSSYTDDRFTKESFVPDEEIQEAIVQIIQQVLNTTKHIPEDTDLFSFGIDSTACMEIRAELKRHLLLKDSAHLPLNVVYDWGTVRQLSKFILSLRTKKKIEIDDDYSLIQKLVEDRNGFADMDPETKQNARKTSRPPSDKHAVILTGATGALGSHILSQLCAMESVVEICCLIRATSTHAAQERVWKSLKARKLNAGLEEHKYKIGCHPFKISDPLLGLSEELYHDLAHRTTLVVHTAWMVNFSARLPSFVKDHINGLHNLLNFALASRHKTPPRFLFCSSTASVLGGPHAKLVVPEEPTLDPLTASPLGYSLSKWVGERICCNANENTRLAGNIAVLRIGQLCGDTDHGIWNDKEAWPLMLSSVEATGSLPDLDDTLDWLPLDVAAKAVIDVGFAEGLERDQSESNLRCYHIVNTRTETGWQDFLVWLGRTKTFDSVPPSEWVRRLEDSDCEHPAKKLLGLWKAAYSGRAKPKPRIRFEMGRTRVVSPTTTLIEPIGEDLFDHPAMCWTTIHLYNCRCDAQKPILRFCPDQFSPGHGPLDQEIDWMGDLCPLHEQELRGRQLAAEVRAEREQRELEERARRGRPLEQRRAEREEEARRQIRAWQKRGWEG